MKKTRCPYCGKKLNYFQAFIERKKGEHTCRNCGKNSTVYFSKSYKLVIGITVVLAVVLVIISISPYFISDLWGMLWVAIPFLLLYLITPFFLKLVPIKKKNNLDYDRFENNSSSNDSTKIMNKFDGDNSKTKIMPSLDIDNSNDEFLDISDLNL